MTQIMPSPRSSPSIRPASPLSPRFETSRYDMLLQPPNARSIQRGNVRAGRSGNTSLRLPALPRFHPANFPSSHSSSQTTPDDEGAARVPLSPRTHQRMFSQAQKQLLIYQREAVAMARVTSPLGEKPLSPRLVPLGSPGPVTPLELEAETEYLTAGMKNVSVTGVPSKDLIDALLQQEVRQLSSTTKRPAAPSSAR